MREPLSRKVEVFYELFANDVAKVLLFNGSASCLSSLVLMGCVICLMFVSLVILKSLKLSKLKLGRES